MRFLSSRNKSINKSLSESIKLGLANDGGLFIPEYFPKIDLDKIKTDIKYTEFAITILKGFFEGDPLYENLRDICHNAFTFPVPLQKINSDTFILDLCNGPTLSFKDFGARFLAECLSNMPRQDKSTIMVATSGDTGSAVASAFYKKKNTNIIILYPKGKISKKQEHQIACWDSNILSLAVNGTFDDCQKMVKDAFQDPWWQNEMSISSANSINIGRLLPQIIYYAFTSFQYYSLSKEKPGFVIPTGNLGNATAAYWAKEMGFPIREIVLATNENKVIGDFLLTGEYIPQQSKSTLANAMDVGNPSNFERLFHLFPSYDLFKQNVNSVSVSDPIIKETIQNAYQNNKIIICPHTATAFYVRKQLNSKSWIVVSTANPCKFDDIIEPLINNKVPMASQLKEIFDKPLKINAIEPSLNGIKKMLQNNKKFQ
jgi:threonine synthase